MNYNYLCNAMLQGKRSVLLEMNVIAKQCKDTVGVIEALPSFCCDSNWALVAYSSRVLLSHESCRKNAEARCKYTAAGTKYIIYWN